MNKIMDRQELKSGIYGLSSRGSWEISSSKYNRGSSSHKATTFCNGRTRPRRGEELWHNPSYLDCQLRHPWHARFGSAKGYRSSDASRCFRSSQDRRSYSFSNVYPDGETARRVEFGACWFPVLLASKFKIHFIG